jgi:O-acetyl-ADP-ribose deacetylase (regulator of RNase III)
MVKMILKLMTILAKMSFTEQYGDLFELPESIPLVHCVAADFHMGAGIAVKFLQKFGSKEELRSRNIQVGGVTHLNHKGRFIYYLVTKQLSWGKPTYKTLESSLISMFVDLKEKNIKTIGMPKIGCGLDGLQWNIVKNLIKKHQGDVDIIVKFI